MTSKRLKILLHKYANGTCTATEKELLELWLEKQQVKMPADFTDQDKRKIWQKIEANLAVDLGVPKPKRRLHFVWYAAAAAVALWIGFVLISRLYLDNKPHTSALAAVDTVIHPGEDKAVLTLSNGQKIYLTGEGSETTNDQGLTISKTESGLLKYSIDPTKNTGTGYNTISTPRGGQFEVVLPDGSIVTLNAASSLRFATDMHRQEKRTVTLHGEGYFDVAKNKNKPFIVETDQQQIEVLGTIFNVNSYNTQKSVTTLLEGAVLINNRQKLRPGQQAQVEPNKLNISTVDVQDFVDWKKNVFVFRQENLQSIMERISRWYDIEYTFQNPAAKSVAFNGEISRYAHVEQVLDLLRMTSNVRFQIQGRAIVIQ